MVVRKMARPSKLLIRGGQNQKSDHNFSWISKDSSFYQNHSKRSRKDHNGVRGVAGKKLLDLKRDTLHASGKLDDGRKPRSIAVSGLE